MKIQIISILGYDTV